MEYKSITGENFYYTEIKNAARYLLKNPDVKNIRDEFKENDVLDCTSESNFKKKFFSINKRINHLTDELKYQVTASDSNTGKFINLYVILCSERLILEFADEIIKEKYKNFDYFLKESEIDNFIKLKSEQSEAVEKWSESGKKKMVVKIKNFFIEGGFLLKEEEKRYKIVKPIVLSEIIQEMKLNGNSSVVKAMLY